MKETIKLVNKQRDVLVDVIQWLDEKNFSNTKIREKVDHILNHSRKLHEESDMELTKIKLKHTNLKEKYASLEPDNSDQHTTAERGNMSENTEELKRIAAALERLADFFEKHHTPIYEDEAKVMDV